MLFIVTSVFVAIGAINGQNNVLFWVFGVAIAAILVSGVAGGQALMGLVARRERVRTLRAGAATPWAFLLENRSRWAPAMAIRVTEIEGFADAECAPAVAHSVPTRGRARGHARGPTRVEAWIRPTRRGVRTLAGVRLSTSFPFGLSRRIIEFDQPGEVLVLPRRVALPAGLADRVVSRARIGESRRRGSGFGDDVYGVREYVPGDSPRTIAWHASARTDQLRVRQFGETVTRRVWVAVAPPIELGARDAVVDLAASLIEDLCKRGVAAGLAIAGHGGTLAPASNERHVRAALELLARFDADGVERGGGDSASVRGPGPGDSVVRVGPADRGSPDWPAPVEVVSATDVAGGGGRAGGGAAA